MGDYARTIIIQDGVVVDVDDITNEEWKNGLLMEDILHDELFQFATPQTTFEELYYYMNHLIEEKGFINLDFIGNLGHSIVKQKNARVYIEKGNSYCLGDVAFFTFEPHINNSLDKRVGVLKVCNATEDGKMELLILRLTAHCNALKRDNYMISPDFYCPIMIIQGAAGNVAPKSLSRCIPKVLFYMHKYRILANFRRFYIKGNDRRRNAMYDLSGLWKVQIDDGKEYEMELPGSLDESGIGHKDAGSNQCHPDSALGNAEAGFDENAPIATRFTRKVTFEGEARIYKRIQYLPEEGKRVFLKVDRARCLHLLIDGVEVPDYIPSSISTPHIFEVTGLLTGDNEICFLSDNSYPGLPHDDIVYSSAATDETQTNWNGLLGEICIYEEEPVYISNIYAYPKGDVLTVHIEMDGDRQYAGQLSFTCDAFSPEASKTMQIRGKKGKTTFIMDNLPLKADVKRWDEYEGNLYDLTALFMGYEGAGEDHGISNCAAVQMMAAKKTITFGVRDFGDDGTGRLALNNRRIFIRSEANCGEFPETGYSPATVEEWMDILGRFKAYGVNLMRFHSHCPAEAAFIAADKMGMLMQPELSQWNPKNALETEESVTYYTRELTQIIRMLANHPSFVMLTLGNELNNGEVGSANMDKLVNLARELDDTRLYANGSNTHYGERGCDANSDFAQSQRYFGADLRGIFAAMTEKGIEGFINNEYPSARHNYNESMEILRKDYKKPVYSFEVGQFEVLPDFDELEDFKGVTDPVNYKLIKEKVEKQGLLPVWKRYVEATGELAFIGYRAEVEAVLRTPQLSGISLLGLQDFPGQGTALVGMMNSHLKPKPFDFAKTDRFRAFFRDQLPMVYLPKYTWETTEVLSAPVVVANYGKQPMEGKVTAMLMQSGQSFTSEEEYCCPVGELTRLCDVTFDLSSVDKPSRLDLKVTFAGIENSYPIWVYPATTQKCPADVYETKTLDEEAMRILAGGGKVFLAPDAAKEALPKSIKAQFTTDFWSVGTFAMQEGSMGQLIDTEHPIFKNFPTEFHTNWQWWPMANTRAVILPGQMETIITEMDSYAYLRPMAQLFECSAGGGKLLFSSMGLQNLQQYPEARALLDAIYKYMASEEYSPVQEMSLEQIKELVR